MRDTWTSEVPCLVPYTVLPLVHKKGLLKMISMSVLEPICSPCGDRQHALITYSTQSHPPPPLHWEGGGLFKFPACPVRIGAVCPLNLCLKNVTFDPCAALSHPVAHIQCGRVCWGSAEEVSAMPQPVLLSVHIAATPTILASPSPPFHPLFQRPPT